MLEYRLTPADLAAFTLWRAGQPGEPDARRRRYRIVAAWVAGTLAYLVAFAVSTLPLLWNLQLPWAVATEVVDLAVGIAVGWWEWRRGRLADRLGRGRALSRARLALERSGADRRAWLDADGLNIGSGDRVARLPWASVNRVVETDDHVFVLTGPDAAHVIPRRTDGVEDLLAALRARL